MYGAQTSLRRDAQRNRAAIVLAASEVLSCREPVALMSRIARRAGVSPATLYRHFPDRQALATAVIGHHLQALEAACRQSVEHPELFRPLLREVLHTQVTMRALVLLALRLESGPRHRYQQRIIRAFAQPLRSAQEHGLVRADLEAEDLMLLFAMVQGVTEAMEDVVIGPAAAERSIDLLLDGLFRDGLCPDRLSSEPALPERGFADPVRP